MGLDSVHRVRGGDGARVSGGIHADTAWKVSGGEAALGDHDPWWGATHLKYGFSNLRGTTELTH